MAQEVQDPAQAPAKRKKFKVNFAPGEVEDGDEQAFADLQTKRRKTREKQYQLEASVDRNQEDLQDVNSSFFDDVMDSLNEQHRNIMHVREAQQDSNVTRKISMNLVKRVQKLDSNSRISLKKFLVCLKEKFSEADDDDDNEDGGDGGYDEEEDAASRSGRASSKRKAAVSMADERDAAMSWTKLGAAAGRLFLSPVGMETMLGPISKPKVVKTIVRKAKQKDAPVALINPEKIDNLDMTQGGASSGQGDDDDVTEVTFARISKLDKVVKARSAKKKKKGDDSNGDTFKKFAVLDVLFDSKDVVQTMENMFDFAFLIKEGEVLTQYDQEKRKPYAVSADKAAVDSGVTSRKQHVLTLSVAEMHEIMDYMKENNVGNLSSLLKDGEGGSGSDSDSESDSDVENEDNPLHRNDNLYKATSVQEQIQILTQQDDMRKAKRKRWATQTQAKKKAATQASQQVQSQIQLSSPSPASSQSQSQAQAQAHLLHVVS